MKKKNLKSILFALVVLCAFFSYRLAAQSQGGAIIVHNNSGCDIEITVYVHDAATGNFTTPIPYTIGPWHTQAINLPGLPVYWDNIFVGASKIGGDPCTNMNYIDFNNPKALVDCPGTHLTTQGCGCGDSNLMIDSASNDVYYPVP